MNVELAKFKCLNPDCGHVYEHPPGISECPKCGNIRMRWLNYRDKK